MARQQNRGSWYTARLLLLVSLCLVPASLRAELLIGVRWSAVGQLEELASAGLRVRYVAPRVALVQGDERTLRALEEQGLAPFMVDAPPPGHAYFLTDHLDLPLAPGVALIHSDPAGWALLRLPRSRFAEALEHHHFLWPLPEEYSLKGWRAPRPKVAAPHTASITQLLSAVDEQRLRAHVGALALEDPALGSGSPDNWRTRFVLRRETFEATEYIRDQLRESLGENTVEIQEFEISGKLATSYVRGSGSENSGEDTTAYKAYNVIGTLYGTDLQAGYYVICAHYDAIGARSRGGWDWRTDPAPGADDNASGVALVLECARILAGQSLPWSIRFIAFSGEELGLWGSKHYATQAVERGERIIGVLNFDMIGFNDLRQRLELVTNPASRWLVEQMRDSNRRHGIGLKLDVLEDVADPSRYKFILSDHAPFWAEGFDAILGIENYLPFDSTTAGVRNGEYRLNTQYHSVLDLPDSLNYELVTRTTRLAIATLAQYGLEEGLPNLAVFTGDLRSDAQDDLLVRVSNIGMGRLDEPYRVRVSRCGPDSTGCAVIYDQERQVLLAPGAVEDIAVPWGRFGETVFLVEVDVDGRVVEQDEEDNRAFQQVRLVPHEKIAIFPNPFRPGGGRYLSFSGLPLRARVYIANLQGERVWAGEEARQGTLTREVRWRGENEGGFAVNSGVYLYTITAEDGAVLRRDKIAVVR